MSNAQERAVLCPYCGIWNYALISYYDKFNDNDWDDGTCVACTRPIISERCGSIVMLRPSQEEWPRARGAGANRAPTAVEPQGWARRDIHDPDALP
jgi:hypothetical protein